MIPQYSEINAGKGNKYYKGGWVSGGLTTGITLIVDLCVYHFPHANRKGQHVIWHNFLEITILYIALKQV